MKCFSIVTLVFFYFVSQSMNKALDRYVIRGVTHNIPLLRDILVEKRFLEGRLSTNYLTEVYPNGFKGRHLNDADRLQLAAFSAILRTKRELRNLVTPTTEGTWHYSVQVTDQGQALLLDCKVQLANRTYQVTVAQQGQEGVQINLADDFSLRDRVTHLNDAPNSVNDALKGSTSRTFQYLNGNSAGDLEIQYCGTKYRVAVQTEKQVQFGKLMPKKTSEVRNGDVKAPMPGLLKSLAVKEGDQVAEGQEVCVLEAMKMQNSLLAPRSGKITKLYFAVGTSINEEDLIAEIN